ncbi:protein LNK3-like isoform X1 [Bidens hawaiensis]|uniref:protein LNK3-like isoform X1 n=1 Tax=Bidens hawaiensis TaxID=980011 RepID=UPI00404B4D3E
MEWYFGNEVDDLVVPKNYEQPQMISSPENWSQWGMTGFVNSPFPKKNFNSGDELGFNGGKNFYSSFDESNNETSKSNNSSMTQELYNNGGSLLWNNEADYRQFAEEEARINHMNDIFFGSFLEEDPTKESTEPHDNTILGNDANNIFESEMMNTQYVGRHGQSFGSSKYLKTHAFSPSTDWGNGEVSTNYQMPKQYTSNENTEESVLNDLERVTAQQFTDKTRICFRDAFYRLAESSKQSTNSCGDGESMTTCIDDTLSAGGRESKTNVIDRAVASLVFHKNEYYDDAQPTAY